MNNFFTQSKLRDERKLHQEELSLHADMMQSMKDVDSDEEFVFISPTGSGHYYDVCVLSCRRFVPQLVLFVAS